MHPITDLLLIVKKHITNDSDIVWTRFESPKEMRDEIDRCGALLETGNVEILKTIDLYFAPTGVFQEHSISNGWTDEYMQLAERFDKLLKK